MVLRSAAYFRVLLLLGGALTPGCHRKSADLHPDVQVAVEFATHPPVVGVNHMIIALTDEKGALQLKRLEVHGTMTHPGMAPISAVLTETAPDSGRYAASIGFTMAGDWVLWLPDYPEKKIDVRGVTPK